MPTVTVLDDTFSDPTTVNVASRPALVGGGWTPIEVTAGAGVDGARVIGGTGFAYSAAGSGASGNRSGLVLTSDDWDVYFDVDRPNNFGGVRLMAGASASGVGGWMLLLSNFSDTIRLFSDSTSFAAGGEGAERVNVGHVMPLGGSTYQIQKRGAVLRMFRSGVQLGTDWTDPSPTAAPGCVMFWAAQSDNIGISRVWATIEAPDGPVVTGPTTFNLAENDTSSGPLFSTDIGLGAGFPTLGGVDAARFNLVSVGANQWRAVRTAGPDFENPDDVGANRVFDITFNASASVSAPCAITLTNVVELPGAPTIGTASAGNATVTINGTAPAPNGGPSVTGYQATLSPGAITKTSATLPINFTSTDGVVNGTAYTGTLRAINSDGTGPASASSNPVTPSTGATATAVTVTPPTPASGSVGVASGVFTVGLNGTLGAGVTRVVTPSAGAGGGSFSPASVSLTDAQPTATFTYTPSSEGDKSITVTNDGSLSNPAAVSYTATAPAATFSALTDVIAESGINLATGSTVFWTWYPSGRPGAAATGVNGSSTVNAQGRALISHSVAGAGMVVLGQRPGPAVSDDRVFIDFLVLA